MTTGTDLNEALISDDALRTALEDTLSAYVGTPRRVVELARQPSWKRSSFALEALDVRLDDGTTMDMLFKDLSWQALLPAGRLAKPSFLYDPLREIETYRQVLAHQQLGTPTFYGAVVDAEVDRYWLFIEQVQGLELYYVALPTWEKVASWLATMHARFHALPDPSANAQAAHWLAYDAGFYRRWPERALEIVRRAPPEQAQDDRVAIEWLAARYERVVEYLVALPVTLIHGEFYAGNVLVDETDDSLRVCPVDWEMTALGPGLVDLAALVSGHWPEESKMAMATAYYQALPGDQDKADIDSFLEALNYCRLHVAMQWLGWSPEWTPPPEQTYNWMDEALGLARKLGL